MPWDASGIVRLVSGTPTSSAGATPRLQPSRPSTYGLTNDQPEPHRLAEPDTEPDSRDRDACEVVAIPGVSTHLILESNGRVRLSTRRIFMVVNGNGRLLDATFRVHRGGDIAMRFTATRKPGTYPLLLAKVDDRKLAILDRSKLVVRRGRRESLGDPAPRLVRCPRCSDGRLRVQHARKGRRPFLERPSPASRCLRSTPLSLQMVRRRGEWLCRSMLPRSSGRRWVPRSPVEVARGWWSGPHA